MVHIAIGWRGEGRRDASDYANGGSAVGIGRCHKRLWHDTNHDGFSRRSPKPFCYSLATPARLVFVSPTSYLSSPLFWMISISISFSLPIFNAPHLSPANAGSGRNTQIGLAAVQFSTQHPLNRGHGAGLFQAPALMAKVGLIALWKSYFLEGSFPNL